MKAARRGGCLQPNLTMTEDKFEDLKQRLKNTDDGVELLATFWEKAPDYDPVEAQGRATVLVNRDGAEPYFTHMSSFSCDAAYNTSTRTVTIDGERYFEDRGDSSLYHLDTYDLEVWVPRENIARILRVPRSGAVTATLDQDIGFKPEADPFRDE